MAPLFRLLLALLLSIFSAEAAADSFQAKVIRVLDGDTVEVLDIETNTHSVRPSGVG